MSDFLHGAYGDALVNGNRVSVDSNSAMVCVGTAPVHQLALGTGESYPVNVPKVVYNIADAKKYFGYSDNWADYTLCEAMQHFFQNEGVGPLVLINVLDPTKAAHKAASDTSVTKTPSAGAITIADAEDIILDSIVVQTAPSQGDPVEKEKGTDYTAVYNAAKKAIVITELSAGALGTDALTVKYREVLPSGVTSGDVVGSTDGAGTNTGLYAVKNVYPLTGIVPAWLMAPGWSGIKAVHDGMIANSKKVNGHWDMFVFADIPLVDNDTAITMETARTWKATNGYNKPNEKVYFPMAEGVDGKKYHLSVLAAANFLKLLAENDGIPYHSESNTEVSLIAKLYVGEGNANKVYDDEMINDNLNKYGIASAAFVGGRWVIWGASAADYTPEDKTEVNVSATAMMMLYYVSNDFQLRRPGNVDQPMTANDLASIVAEEQNRLDALVAMGALLYGAAELSAESLANSDVYSGDFLFEFRVTTTPLAKSLKALVAWVDEGFSTYFATLESAVA